MTSSSTGMNMFCDNRSLLNPLSSSMECQSYLAHWQRSNRTSLQNPLGPHKISELLTLASLWLSNSLDLNTWVSHWSPLLDFHLCLNGLTSVVTCILLAILLKDVTCCFSPLPWFGNLTILKLVLSWLWALSFITIPLLFTGLVKDQEISTKVPNALLLSSW